MEGRVTTLSATPDVQDGNCSYDEDIALEVGVM
jgi:hypothetical protein